MRERERAALDHQSKIKRERERIPHETQEEEGARAKFYVTTHVQLLLSRPHLRRSVSRCFCDASCASSVSRRVPTTRIGVNNREFFRLFPPKVTRQKKQKMRRAATRATKSFGSVVDVARRSGSKSSSSSSSLSSSSVLRREERGREASTSGFFGGLPTTHKNGGVGGVGGRSSPPLVALKTATTTTLLKRFYANDPTIEKGAYPIARKKHELELNALRKIWREEFERKAREKREENERERERLRREHEERRKEKLHAFEDKTDERKLAKAQKNERRDKKRAKTEHRLKQKMAATERRSRWRNVELYAEAEKWISRDQLEMRIEKALKSPERMY